MITDVEPIVTARFGFDDSHTLDRSRATGGYEGLKAALAMTPAGVVDVVAGASVRGRGGAGFPAGNKWRLLPEGVFPRYVVVNGDESEPGTCKDRPLMERDPHQAIEGALICAYAIGAERIFFYVRGEMALAQERVIAAVNEAYEAGLAGTNVLGSGFDIDVIVHPGAGAYIVGDETALMESLEGNRGMPRLKPPYFPAAMGVYLQPTVVNNVETLATLPWILRKGADAFTALGGERASGTRIHSLSGHVRRPGNYEIELAQMTFRELIYAPSYGSGISNGNLLKMFIPGGASAPWFYEEQLDLPLHPDVVAANGSMLGSGAIIVMDETTCAVRAAWRLVRFFARESCGKCTPCREGGGWLAKILHRIETGAGRVEDLDLLLDLGDNISPGPFPSPAGVAGRSEPVAFPYRRTTICDLGPSAVAPVFSAVGRFRDEFLVHIKDGSCPHG